MVPNSSESRRHQVFFGKAARATRGVCSGTEYEEDGGRDSQTSSRKIRKLDSPTVLHEASLTLKHENELG
jgi:hypothetical protein